MKKLVIMFAASFLFAFISFAQQDTIPYQWIPKAAAGANLSQISFSDWTQGGEDALSWTLLGNGSLYYRTVEWFFKNDLKITFGKTKLGSSDFRTTDNDLYFENVISKRIGWGIDPYFSNTLRTAITTGFNYKTDPPTEIADFFDPGYLSQSLGFTYDRIPGIITRFGFAVQETFTKRFTFYTDDKTTTWVERGKIETGIESVTNAEYRLMENILYKGKLRLFSRYETLDVWDVRWDNIISAKVNDYVHVNFNFILIYEEARLKKRQIKESLQIGILFNLL